MKLKGSDQNLVEQLVSNDPAIVAKGWQYIYKNHFPMVKDLIRKYNGTESDAIDIFQDGLLILNRNLKNGEFRGEASIKTYIFSICKNLWLKEYHKKQKQLTLETELSNDFQKEEEYIKNVEVVSRLMNELREDCRKILTEYYYNNKTMEELKNIFKVNSVQAAKNKKWRCLSYLVKLFKERGITYMQLIENE